MKFEYFPKTTKYSENDDVLITYPEVPGGIARCGVNTIRSIVKDGAFTPDSEKKNIYEYKEIPFTEELMNEIQNGNFSNINIGNYFMVDNVQWMIVDYDYWMDMTDEGEAKHHLVIMPMCTLHDIELQSEIGYRISWSRIPYNGQLYEFSFMKSILYAMLNIEFYYDYLKIIFNDHIVKHAEYLPVCQMARAQYWVPDTGYPSTGSMHNVTTHNGNIGKMEYPYVSLANSIMIFGDGKYLYKTVSLDDNAQNICSNELHQLAAFKLTNDVLFINKEQLIVKDYWADYYNTEGTLAPVPYFRNGNVWGHQPIIKSDNTIEYKNARLLCQEWETARLGDTARPIFALG